MPDAASSIVKLAIVEDSGVYRESLATLCRKSDYLRLVGAYSSAREALEGVAAADPDVVLIDLGLPDGHGADVIKHLRQVKSRAECLVLTVYDDDRHLFPALEAGAIGYVLKDQTDEASLVAAIQEVMQGGAPMSASVARRVLGSFLGKKAPPASAQQGTSPVLTTRENEIMEKLAQGHSARKVAQLLDISYHTVRCHQKNIYKKLHVSSALEALAALNQS